LSQLPAQFLFDPAVGRSSRMPRRPQEPAEEESQQPANGKRDPRLETGKHFRFTIFDLRFTNAHIIGAVIGASIVNRKS
jgi:hypothetical protein